MRVTEVVAATTLVVAVKDPEELPAPAMTLAGTLTVVLLLESATLAPPLGAAADSVTLAPLAVPEERLRESVLP